MVRKYFINLVGKNRIKKYNFHLGVILAFIAGAVNAGSFLYVGHYTSHMTGIASSLADFIVLKDFHLAVAMALFLLSFIFGSAASAILINWARDRNYRGEFAIPMMFEALLILLFGLSTISNFIMNNFLFGIVALLCFIMGLQNAIITKISHAEIRTTHVTGVVTDIGIQFGRMFYKLLNKKTAIRVEHESLRMHLTIFFAFCFGGVIGALSFKNFGSLSVIPFAIFLMIVSVVTILFDEENQSVL